MKGGRELALAGRFILMELEKEPIVYHTRQQSQLTNGTEERLTGPSAVSAIA
jgi:hypothetical protein